MRHRLPWALCLLWACGGGPSEPKVEAPQVVRVAAESPLELTLLPSLAAEYSRHSGVEVELVEVGSSGPFRQLLSGDVDLIATSRRPVPVELEQARADRIDLNADAARQLFATDVVGVFVHPENAVRALTYDEVRATMCSAQVRDWSDLGGPQVPIRAVAPGPGVGTRAVFEDFFCGYEGFHRSVRSMAMHDVLDVISTEPGALSFGSMAHRHGRMIALMRDPGDRMKQPSRANVVRGAYPLYRDLYAWTAGPADGPTADLLAWLAKPAAQEIVDESGFVPLFLRPPDAEGPRALREVVHFDAQSDQPHERSLARMELLAAELKAKVGPSQRVRLEGFAGADERDPERLGLERARVVEQLLKARLPDVDFEVVSRGTEDPIAPNATPYGRQRNRRVQVYVTDAEPPTAASKSSG